MKTKFLRKKLLLFLILHITIISFSQSVDSTSFTICSRLSFYSFEKDGEILLHIPQNLIQTNIDAEISLGGQNFLSYKGKTGKKILRLPFQLNMAPSVYKLSAKITVPGNSRVIYLARADLFVLSYKTNEVKIDRITGGMFVNRQKFFPFGFYCYSPVHPTLPEEEVVKGFNMISPYQKILPETLPERKSYMDRCARLGMKVHYNLLSVSGGGGVASKIEGLDDLEKRKRMIAEIKTFMDHPALLAWYISDEPNGFKIPPEILEEIYRTIKEIDPWHPVSMVFMAPFMSAKKYANALDIVMADPYPIPVNPVTVVGDATGLLKSEFSGKRAVWIVPQAFGGGEWWEREPTIQEMRTMTWQAIIKGATGIQYFVRQGLHYFPKSAAAWGECGRMAIEVAELTPWLLSDEETLPVESNTGNILVTSRLLNGQLIVMAVNKINKPVSTTIRITGINKAIARVLFENRSITVNGGTLSDQIAPFGSQVYMINIKPEAVVPKTATTNLIMDPGFEDLTSPGLPSACYARPGGDRGSTYFLDTREYYEGYHSVRLITPVTNKGTSLRFFPVQVKAGASYTISLWARSDPEQRFSLPSAEPGFSLEEKSEMPQYVEILFGEFSRARFVPDNEWRQYITFVKIPSDTTAKFRTNLILKMPGQGVAWFDMVKVFEEK